MYSNKVTQFIILAVSAVLLVLLSIVRNRRNKKIVVAKGQLNDSKNIYSGTKQDSDMVKDDEYGRYVMLTNEEGNQVNYLSIPDVTFPGDSFMSKKDIHIEFEARVYRSVENIGKCGGDNMSVIINSVGDLSGQKPPNPSGMYITFEDLTGRLFINGDKQNAVDLKIDDGKWHKIRISKQGINLVVDVDDKNTLNHTFTLKENSDVQGNIVFRSFSGSCVNNHHVRNVVISRHGF